MLTLQLVRWALSSHERHGLCNVERARTLLRARVGEAMAVNGKAHGLTLAQAEQVRVRAFRTGIRVYESSTRGTLEVQVFCGTLGKAHEVGISREVIERFFGCYF